MAFAATRISRNIVGNQVEEIWALDFASVTTGTFKTGLSTVEFAKFNNEVTEDAGLLKRNTSTGSDVVGGAVLISGVTSSDVGRLLVKGH